MKIVLLLIVGLILGTLACDAKDEETLIEHLPITFNDEMRALDECYWYGGIKKLEKYKDPKIPDRTELKATCVDGQVFMKHW